MVSLAITRRQLPASLAVALARSVFQRDLYSPSTACKEEEETLMEQSSISTSEHDSESLVRKGKLGILWISKDLFDLDDGEPDLWGYRVVFSS